MTVPVADHDEVAEGQFGVLLQGGADGGVADSREEVHEVAVLGLGQVEGGQGLHLVAQIIVDFDFHRAP